MSAETGQETPTESAGSVSAAGADAAPPSKVVRGLRLERLANSSYYKVVLHIGSTYVPVADETLADLKSHSLMPAERFLELMVDKIGYSSYLKEQIRAELKAGGDTLTQVTVLQGIIRNL